MKTPPITELKCIGFKKFNLKPFGKFRIRTDHKNYKSNNDLEFDRLSFDSRTALQLLPAVERKLIKMMIDNNTEILVYGWEFYTIVGGLVKVEHHKISDYVRSLCSADNYNGTWVEDNKV
jgi:hypothetical protein